LVSTTNIPAIKYIVVVCIQFNRSSCCCVTSFVNINYDPCNSFVNINYDPCNSFVNINYDPYDRCVDIIY
jgi:hypothetical protein